MQILEKYRLNFKIEEDQDANNMQKYKDTIQDFQGFLRKVISVMEVRSINNNIYMLDLKEIAQRND